MERTQRSIPSQRMDFFRSTLRITIILTIPFLIINLMIDPLFVPPLAVFLAALGLLHLIIPSWSDLAVFRAFSILLSGMVMFLLAVRAGKPDYYIFALVVPLVYYAFLGYWEGLFWALGFLVFLLGEMLVLYMIYSQGSLIRFAVMTASYLAVTGIAHRIQRMYTEALGSLKDAHEELIRHHELLVQARQEMDTLRTVLPMCSGCKKILDDTGAYVPVDEYITEHTKRDISHGLCPECIKRLYPDMSEQLLADHEKDLHQ